MSQIYYGTENMNVIFHSIEISPIPPSILYIVYRMLENPTLLLQNPSIYAIVNVQVCLEGG